MIFLSRKHFIRIMHLWGISLKREYGKNFAERYVILFLGGYTLGAVVGSLGS